MSAEICERLSAGHYLYRDHRIVMMRPALWRIIGPDDKEVSDAKSKRLAVEIIDSRLDTKRSKNWPRRFAGAHHGRTKEF